MQSFLGVLFWNNIIIFQFNGGLEYIKRKGLVTGSNPMCCCYLKQRNIFIFHFRYHFVPVIIESGFHYFSYS